MRRLIASLLTGGSLVACVAFFLPWVGLSCQGETMTAVSPAQRAMGVEPDSQTERDVVDQRRGEDDPYAPEASYWLLLLLPAAVAGSGAAGLLMPGFGLRAVCLAALPLAAGGLLLTVTRGLRDQLGLAVSDELAELGLRSALEPGVWLALAGQLLAFATAVVGAFLGPRADVP